MTAPAPEESVSVKNLVEADLQKIWADPRFTAFCGCDFMAPASIRPNSLLFVGINPSYTEADKDTSTTTRMMGSTLFSNLSKK